MAELARLRVGVIVGLVYGLGGPHSDMAICVASGLCLVMGDTGETWVRAYHRQPLQASSRPGRHGSCKPRSPSVRLSHPAQISVYGELDAYLQVEGPHRYGSAKKA